MADQLSDLYQDLLDGTYDCVDRVVSNAYFRRAIPAVPSGFGRTGNARSCAHTYLSEIHSRW